MMLAGHQSKSRIINTGQTVLSAEAGCTIDVYTITQRDQDLLDVIRIVSKVGPGFTVGKIG